jgi:ABC-type Mn2+/Zn2+ transport system permease subunit
VVVSGMFGLGGLLALSPDAPARLEELLFGDPLGVTDADLIAAAALAVLGGAALLTLHRPLSAVAFDAAGAAAAGVAPARVRLALLFLLATALAVAVQGLGSLLVLAVLVAPAVAVRRHAHTPRTAMLAGATVAAGAGLVGLYASHHVGSAAGASVALALCAAAALGSLRRPPARARPATA